MYYEKKNNNKWKKWKIEKKIEKKKKRKEKKKKKKVNAASVEGRAHAQLEGGGSRPFSGVFRYVV
jgi:hypothetical protein